MSGQAQVQQTIHLEVRLDPDLRAKIEEAVNSRYEVPLIGGGTGRMDSDAGPTRIGGIGHF